VCVCVCVCVCICIYIYILGLLGLPDMIHDTLTSLMHVLF